MLWWRLAPTVPLPALAAGSMIEPRRDLPDFNLIDHEGRAFTRERLLGSWSLLYFGYTQCPDACPATLATLAGLQKRLRSAGGGPLPRVVFISVDTARDTPQQLARYVPYFDPGFIGVTAQDQGAVEALARTLGVVVLRDARGDGRYSIDHTDALFVIDPRGRLAAILNGPFVADSLQGDYQRVVAARG